MMPIVDAGSRNAEREAVERRDRGRRVTESQGLLVPILRPQVGRIVRRRVVVAETIERSERDADTFDAGVVEAERIGDIVARRGVDKAAGGVREQVAAVRYLSGYPADGRVDTGGAVVLVLEVQVLEERDRDDRVEVELTGARTARGVSGARRGDV